MDIKEGGGPKLTTFAERLQHLRELRGIKKPSDLDKLCDLTVGTTYRVEKGERSDISATTFMAYVRILGASPHWLWAHEGPMELAPQVAPTDVTPDDLDNRVAAARIARRKTVPEETIRDVVTNPFFNTPEYQRKKLREWVTIFEAAEIQRRRPAPASLEVDLQLAENRAAHPRRAFVQATQVPREVPVSAPPSRGKSKATG